MDKRLMHTCRKTGIKKPNKVACPTCEGVTTKVLNEGEPLEMNMLERNGNRCSYCGEDLSKVNEVRRDVVHPVYGTRKGNNGWEG